MRRFLCILFLLVAMSFFVGGNAFAYTLTYDPTPSDIYDLEHSHAYEWGIDASDLAALIEDDGVDIVSVTLSFTYMKNWTDEENALFVHLLDNASKSEYLNVYDDNKNEISDYFGTDGLLTTFLNLPDEYYDYEYVFTSEQIDDLLAYLFAADADGEYGFFSLGFDPDCHFFNKGVTLTVVTTPEPATMLLLGAGLIGLAGIGRKKLLK